MPIATAVGDGLFGAIVGGAVAGAQFGLKQLIGYGINQIW